MHGDKMNPLAPQMHPLIYKELQNGKKWLENDYITIRSTPWHLQVITMPHTYKRGDGSTTTIAVCQPS